MKQLKFFYIAIFLLILVSKAKAQAKAPLPLPLPNPSIETANNNGNDKNTPENDFKQVKSHLEKMINSTDFRVFGVHENTVKANLSKNTDWFDCITPTQRNAMNALYNNCSRNSNLNSSSTQNWQSRIPGMSTLICLYSGIINFSKGSSRANENYMKSEIIGKTSLSIGQKRQAEIGLYRCLLSNTNGTVWTRSLPAELLEPIVKDNDLMTGVMREWFTNMMNGRDYVIPTKTNDFKAVVVPLKAMMCVFGSLVINGCPASSGMPKSLTTTVGTTLPPITTTKIAVATTPITTKKNTTN